MSECNHWVHILAKGYSRWGSDGYSNGEYSTISWSNPPAYGGSHTNTTHVLMGQTGKDGGSQSHNNMSPYLVVYLETNSLIINLSFLSIDNILKQ